MKLQRKRAALNSISQVKKYKICTYPKNDSNLNNINFSDSLEIADNNNFRSAELDSNNNGNYNNNNNNVTDNSYLVENNIIRLFLYQYIALFVIINLTKQMSNKVFIKII